MLTTTHNEGAVRILRFNRPEALNAFSEAMFDAVAEDLLAAEGDDSVKVLIITGEGRAFSAGMDLSDRPGKGSLPVHGFAGMFEAFVEFPNPSIKPYKALVFAFALRLRELQIVCLLPKAPSIRSP